MHNLIACKYEKDQVKHSGENVMTSFSPLQVYGFFFQTLKGTDQTACMNRLISTHIVACVLSGVFFNPERYIW